MSISYAGSIDYFQNHMLGDVWTKAGETVCESAIAQARRQLSRAMGRELQDDEDAYAEGDLNRDEYAVYEQALWLIVNGPIANGAGTAPVAMLVADGGNPENVRERDRRYFSPEALAWLGCSMGRLQLSRG